ncbi:MAG: amiC, partial [Burkholderiales bacterium]|nr:amiC [Burkholderiales bacterium]
MSKEFDGKRRKFVQLGIFCGINLLISRKVFADELADFVDSHETKNELIAVRLWPSSIYTRLTLEAEKNIVANKKVLDNPLRLIIEINGITLNGVLNNLNTKVLDVDPVIKDIQVSQPNLDSVKIIILLKQH